MGKKHAFSRLRRNAAAGDIEARERLRTYVQRRLGQGWKLQTIAKRVGLQQADLKPYLPAPTPRLVRREPRP